jgi:hypothetical protein
MGEALSGVAVKLGALALFRELPGSFIFLVILIAIIWLWYYTKENKREQTAGIITNIVLKTAIKKALLDVTNHIEQMTRQSSNFGERVMEYVDNIPTSENLKAATWEGSFARMIAVRAQNEVPSSQLIQNQNDLSLLVSLIAEWVASKGGNVTNVYREFN